MTHPLAYIHIPLKHRLAIFFLLLTVSVLAHAQSPLANRVKAYARHLPENAKLVAKYTDRMRHCVYYTIDNRLYCYDAVTNRSEDINFANKSYHQILATWWSPDGNFLLITIDKGSFSTFYLDDGQELWRYDTRKKTPLKIGQGFAIKRQKGCFVIKRASRCLNPKAERSLQQWMGQDHYYDLYGKTIWAKEEYRIK